MIKASQKSNAHRAEFQRSDIRAHLNLSLFGAFRVGSLVAFRIVFDFWRSFKYLIQIRTFRLFSKCSKFSRRYTWHNVSAINYDFFERFMVFHFIRRKLVLNIISSLIKYHYRMYFKVFLSVTCEVYGPDFGLLRQESWLKVYGPQIKCRYMVHQLKV